MVPVGLSVAPVLWWAFAGFVAVFFIGLLVRLLRALRSREPGAVKRVFAPVFGAGTVHSEAMGWSPQRAEDLSPTSGDHTRSRSARHGPRRSERADPEH